MKVKEFRQLLNKEIKKAKKNGTFRAERYYLYFSHENLISDLTSSLNDESFIVAFNRAAFKEELPVGAMSVLVFRNMPFVENSEMLFYKDIDDYQLFDMLVDDMDMEFIKTNKAGEDYRLVIKEV